MLDFDNFLFRSAAMKVVTYSHARNALKSVLDSVVRDSDARSTASIAARSSVLASLIST
jgi:hypothetical protein